MPDVVLGLQNGRAVNLLPLKIVVAVVALAAASLAFRPDASIVHRPIVEDGYYSLTVARNLAMGRGMTVDGKSLTNGFQPLFTLITTPIYIFTANDRIFALRIVLALHLCFYLATAFLLSKILRDAIDRQTQMRYSAFAWWVILIFISSVLVFVVSFNGLETGFLLFMYALAWRIYQTTHLDGWGTLVGYGIVLGLLALTRIDALAFLLVLSIYELLFHRGIKFTGRISRAAVLNVVAFLVSSPWWLFNKLNFGSFMPTSGNAYRSWISFADLAGPAGSQRVDESVSALLRVAMPIFYLGQNTYEGTPANYVRGALILVLVIFLLVRRRDLSRWFEPKEASYRPMIHAMKFSSILLLTVLLLALSYTLSFSAVWFYTRYYSPLLLVSISLLGTAAALLAIRFPRVLNTFAAILALPVLWVIVSLHTGRFQSEYINDQLRLVTSHVPPTEWVAGFQTGTLGYYRDNVLNLDGKVNPRAVEYRSNILSYVEENHIRWICDAQRDLSANLHDALALNGWQRVDSSGQFLLYHKEYLR